MYYIPNFKPVHCSMSGSNCCFLTCIQVLQEAGKEIWYSHLFKNFPQFVVIHKQLRLACECPGVSGGGVGRQWPAAGSGHWMQQCLHVLLKEATITPTIVWPQAKQQGGNTAPPINRKLDWRFTENVPAHQNKTLVPPQSVSPIRKLP